MSPPNIAFIFLSCGPFGRTYKVEMCIESLYRVAKWAGRSYIVTDSPECIDEMKLRKICNSENILVKATPKFSDQFSSPLRLAQKKVGAFQVPHLVRVDSRIRNKSKALKSKIFDFVCEEIDILIYVDADAIFTRTDTLKDLMHCATDWPSDGIKFRVNRWGLAGPGIFDQSCIIHTGFFIAHREYSMKALAAWKQKMQDPASWVKISLDRDLYMSAFQEVATREGSNFMTVIPLPQDFEGVFKPGKEPRMIAHITNARLKANGKKFFEEFIAKLGLQSCPPGFYTLPYIPAWFLTLFRSGYFPSFGSKKLEDRLASVFRRRGGV